MLYLGPPLFSAGNFSLTPSPKGSDPQIKRAWKCLRELAGSIEPVFITGLCRGVKVGLADGRLEAEREAVRGRVRQGILPLD
jgi:hypothetical protein